MKPEELVKIVFSHELVDYEMRFLRNQFRMLVQARQRSAYLLHYFYPYMNLKEIAKEVGYNRHSILIYCYKTVSNGIVTDKKYEREMSKLIKLIRIRIERENEFRKYKNVIEFKMKNKRAILRKKTLGYEIILKRLNHLDGFRSQVELQTLNISNEAMEGIMQAYQMLNSL